MATGRVKGLTIEIGGDTTKLDKALGGVDRNLVTIQKDLQAVERRLKLDPGNTELLAQKQRLLADAVSETAKRMNTLDSAAEGVQKAFSNVEIDDKQLRNFYLELELTESDLKSAERALDSFNDELKQTDSPAGDAADAIKDVGDAAGDAGDSMGGLGGVSGGLSGSLGGLKGVAAGAALAIGKALVDAAINAAKELWNLDEATEEYRVAMGKLNTAFETAGYGPEAAAETYRGFYAVLGDTDTATEASQLLAKLADDEEDLAKWVDIAAGVYGTFGDALPINSLIEAANETKEVGKVTGVLADALNWAGINEDDFNKTLEKIPGSADRANYIMDTLAHTYEDASDAFYKNNEALIANREAQSEIDESLALIGESVSNVKTELMETFGPGLAALARVAAGALNGIAGLINGIGDALEWLGDRVQDVINFFRDLSGVGGKTTSVSSGPNGGGRHSRSIQETYSAASPYSLTAITAQDLPHLARGTVTRPNNPFLAVVGDNPTEQEIIAPLSTIRQAVGEAMSANGGFGGNVRVTVTFNGDLAPLIRQLQPMIVAETDRRGPQAVT